MLPPLPPVLPIQEVKPQAPKVSDFGDELQVTGKVQEIDPIKSIAVYSDGVAAKFGPTIVFADRLEVHQAPEAQYAIARGNVRIEDPEGIVNANYAVFWYGPNRGPDGQIAVADRVEIEIAGVKVKAESVVIKPDRWEFANVEGTNCLRPIPLYSIKSRKVVVLPGKSGTAYHPRITILGKDLGAVPTRRFSLDKRSPGLELPGLNLKGSGVGVNWKSGLLLNQSSLLLGSYSAFPSDYPSYSLAYAHTFLPASVSDSQILARSELTERFAFSYFDNIRVGNIETTRSHTNNLRNSLTVQSVWNTTSSARLDREDFSKALDIAYERSGPIGGLGTNLQLRAQSIRRGDEDFVERGVFSGTLQAPALQFGKNLQSDLRVDLFGVAGEKNVYGWARGQAGLLFKPLPQIGFGAAYISAGESGRADFIADRLVSKQALHLRADLNLGPTKISYLAKFDFSGKNWYDKEYSISQVIGCFEPFLVRREFPSDYAIGIKLRLDDFLSILERRKQVRTKPVGPQTISSLPDKK